MQLWSVATVVAAPWDYVQISNQNNGPWFCLAAGDVNHDGLPDLFSGSSCYLNPGAGAQWQKIDLGVTTDVVAVVDVDGDAFADIVGTHCDSKTLWLEATDGSATQWRSTEVSDIEPCSHGISTQGYALGNFFGDAREEMVISSEAGIFILMIPQENPAQKWPSVTVTTRQTTGLGVTDMDNDGDLDIVGGHEYSESGGDIWWAQNPGSFVGSWQIQVIGRTATGMDRIEAADITGDGHADIVVTEEAERSNLYLFTQPAAGPLSPAWNRRSLGIGAMYLSLDIGDIDRDGDRDIVTGEASGSQKIELWLNSGDASSFTKQTINQAMSRQPHIGCRLLDIDADGDEDLVNNSFSDDSYFFVWKNGGVPTVFAPGRQAGGIVSSRKAPQQAGCYYTLAGKQMHASAGQGTSGATSPVARQLLVQVPLTGNNEAQSQVKKILTDR
jgi:hypothetical protein